MTHLYVGKKKMIIFTKEREDIFIKIRQKKNVMLNFKI